MSDVEIRSDEEPHASPMHGYLKTPKAGKKAPAVIVAHELFGVNADIRGVVDHLAELGYVAVAIELYHRGAPAGEALVRDDAGRKQGFAYLNQLSRDDVLRDVRATMKFLGARDDVNGKIGMLGFSAGGHMAFLAATRLPIAATAVLYPGWLTGGDVPISKPDATIDAAKGITAQQGKLLFAIGGRDAIIKPEQVAEIRKQLEAAAVDHEFIVYPEAEHAFFWEGTPSFHRASRDDAWMRVEKFFDSALKTP